jgi:hypothetical protein
MSKTNISLLLGVFTIAIFLGFAPSTYAAKAFTYKGPATQKVVVRSSGYTIPVSVKFRPDRKGILFSFTSFSGIDSVSYSFTYTGNGQPQGAGGTVTGSNNPSQQRELLFGTCSTSVCTYHGNIQNARLVFTAKLTNGKTATRSFRIKA